MTTEIRTITVDAYRDSKGQPCCAANFQTGAVCLMLRSRFFGTQDVCALEDSGVSLLRRENGHGSLIPHSKCPLWTTTP